MSRRPSASQPRPCAVAMRCRRASTTSCSWARRTARTWSRYARISPSSPPVAEVPFCLLLPRRKREKKLRDFDFFEFALPPPPPPCVAGARPFEYDRDEFAAEEEGKEAEKEAVPADVDEKEVEDDEVPYISLRRRDWAATAAAAVASVVLLLLLPPYDSTSSKAASSSSPPAPIPARWENGGAGKADEADEADAGGRRRRRLRGERFRLAWVARSSRAALSSCGRTTSLEDEARRLFVRLNVVLAKA